MRLSARVGTLVIGLALGAAAGLYIHRWWGHGMFQASTMISALAVLLLGLAVAVAIVERLRGHEAHAATGSMLSVGLIGGAIAAATLGPGYSPAANYEGTVVVHVTAPTTADWTGSGFCWRHANSSDIGGLWLGTWAGPGQPMEGSLGFTETGAPAFRFANDRNGYDLFGDPRPRVEVREIAAGRLSGEVAFSAMPVIGQGLLEAHPDAPLDGTVRWSCDLSKPAR